MLNLLNIVSTHPLREVGELLRRASIKQKLQCMCTKLLGGVMLKAFLPCNIDWARLKKRIDNTLPNLLNKQLDVPYVD